MSAPLAAIIVVGWNSRNDLEDLFSSLLKQDYQNFKIVFVDNNSKDDSVQFIKQHYPQIVVVASPNNNYFAGGNNIGMRFAVEQLQAEYVAIINPDTTCDPNWLSSQITLLSANPKAGIIGPKVLFAPGFGPENGAKSTATKFVINTVGLHRGGYLFPYDIGFGEPDTGQYDSASPRFGVSGVSMVMPAAMLTKIGVFWEPLQMYLEDAELCMRAEEFGYEIYYTPATRVFHKHMQSTKKAGSSFYMQMSRRNYMAIVLKHYGKKRFLRAVFETVKEIGPVATLPKLIQAVSIVSKSFTHIKNIPNV